MKTTHKITQTALLSSVALVFSLLEGLIPPLPMLPPGAKLGLSNIITMFAAGSLGLPTALTIALVKGGFTFLTRNMTAGFMSLSGGLLSTVVMWVVFSKTAFSLSLTGICGAISHNFAQLLCAWILTSTTVVYYIPFLLFTGIVTGLLTGTIFKLTFPHLKKIRYPIKK